MFFRLLALFIVVPLVELAILHYLAQATSLGLTIGLVLVTGFVGTWLAKQQGLRTWRLIQQELGSGRLPTDSMFDGAMILVAGALLLTPGILTDAFGLSLLIPVCRRYYRLWLTRWFRSRFRVQSFSSGGKSPPPTGQSEVIDSYVVDHHDDAPDDKRSS